MFIDISTCRDLSLLEKYWNDHIILMYRIWKSHGSPYKLLIVGSIRGIYELQICSDMLHVLTCTSIQS